MNASAQCVEAPQLIHFDIEPATFAADWRHCDRIANYLAGLASFDRTDSFLYSNLFSTVLNELFEIVFFQHGTEGRVRCSLARSGSEDRIVLEIPANEAQREFYRRSVAEAQAPQVDEAYTRSLLGNDHPDRAVGFLELAADYDAQIQIEEPEESQSLRLLVKVSLEGNLNANLLSQS